ncbi:MAG TPA: hypothetical protein VNB64_03315 [Solirubrobacteraceae bacterium]|nr:hypothetical protein [Solirubrobacteraceae bacterium]
MSPIAPLDPADLDASRKAAMPAQGPLLPDCWRAQALLTPYGDSKSPLANYDQIVVADVTCDNRTAPSYMRVSLYLTESLQYFDFWFSGSSWRWLISTPGGPITGSYGPFDTTLSVPGPDLIASRGGRYGNTWPIMGTMTDGWVLPTPSAGGSPDHGSWYSFTQSGELFRIFTFDSDNPVRLPILGAYYLANLPAFSAQEPDEETLAFARALANGSAPSEAAELSNPLVTQEDLQGALASPLVSHTCTVEQIQAVIPGLVPTPSAPLPVWTDKTYILGWTIGTDFIPYRTLVYYWYTYGRQDSYFQGLGLEPGQGTYAAMQATCLHSDHADPSQDYSDFPQYLFVNGDWTPQCCDGNLPGVGVPRPDFVKATGGEIAASITGNPAFGLGPDETLNLIRCPFQRGAGEEALFWVWFTGEQVGVLFTEANFLNSTDHSLQLIDYELFQRDADNVTESVFHDPCPSLPVCPSSSALARRRSWRRVIGPRAVNPGV